jgi:hypothetical protein
MRGRAARDLERVRAALGEAGIDVIGGDVARAVRAALDTLEHLRQAPAEPPEPVLQGEEAAQVHEEFRRRRCQHCGGAHARACPRVRRLRFHPDSRLAAVEFWPDGTWADEGIMWPESLPPHPDEPAAPED